MMPGELSIFLEGPLFRFLRRMRVPEDRLERVRNQMLFLVPLVAWLPLLVLSAIGGQLSRGHVTAPFLLDLEAHVRLLVAMPLLIIGENVAEWRSRPCSNSSSDVNSSPLMQCPASRQRSRQHVVSAD
jgi:hypothetical protein